MNRKKEPWVDCVWTPFSGCLRECKDCPAKKQVTRFSGDVRLQLTGAKAYGDTEIRVLDSPFPSATPKRSIDFPYGMIPTFHRYRLDTPGKWKKGRNVLVCSLGDLFESGVPDEIIQEIFGTCQKYPQHNYLFLTKNPMRYASLAYDKKLPQLPNMWYGTRVCSTDDGWFTSNEYSTFIVVDILQDMQSSFISPMILQDWVIISKNTKNADEIVQCCNTNGIPVYMENAGIKRIPEKLLNHPHVKHPLKDGRCSFCKEEMPKKAMVSLLYREGRGDSAYALGFACPECFRKLRKRMDADEPIKEYEHE